MLTGFFVSLGGMFFFWVLYLYFKNTGFVDVVWGLNLLLVSFVYFFLYGTSLKHVFILISVFLWAARLSSFLYFTRIKKGVHDGRYKSLEKAHFLSGHGYVLYQFLLQGVLQFPISLALYFSFQSKGDFNLLFFLGGTLFLGALFLETLVDFQQYFFRKQYPGQVCKIGLWRYSRHPNYFFDCLVWVSFVLMGYEHFIAFISPLFLSFLMIFVTIPITEKHLLSSKGQSYEVYQKETRRFFLWFYKESR